MKKYLKADAATAKTTAIKTHLMKIMHPDNTNGVFGLRLAGKITFLNKSIYVQDLNEMQNSQLFEKGIKMIANKVTPKRSDYLLKLLQMLLPSAEQPIEEIMRESQRLVPLIAFVCDIACHSDKKLAHPDAYDKDLKKYVSNLFCVYHLDYGFAQTLKLGGEKISIPEYLVYPEKYNFA